MKNIVLRLGINHVLLTLLLTYVMIFIFSNSLFIFNVSAVEINKSYTFGETESFSKLSKDDKLTYTFTTPEEYMLINVEYTANNSISLKIDDYSYFDYSKKGFRLKKDGYVHTIEISAPSREVLSSGTFCVSDYMDSLSSASLHDLNSTIYYSNERTSEEKYVYFYCPYDNMKIQLSNQFTSDKESLRVYVDDDHYSSNSVSYSNDIFLVKNRGLHYLDLYMLGKVSGILKMKDVTSYETSCEFIDTNCFMECSTNLFPNSSSTTLPLSTTKINAIGVDYQGDWETEFSSDEICEPFEYTVIDEDILTISGSGKIFAKKIGSTEVFIKNIYNGKTNKITLSVINLQIDTGDISIRVGTEEIIELKLNCPTEKGKFNCEYIYNDYANIYTTYLDDYKYKNGLYLEAKKKCIINLKVTEETYHLEKIIKINITAPYISDFWYLSDMDMEVGESQDLYYRYYPSDAITSKISFSSSDPSIAIVTTTGKVTALKTGIATITIVDSLGGATKSARVTVSPKKTVISNVSKDDDLNKKVLTRVSKKNQYMKLYSERKLKFNGYVSSAKTSNKKIVTVYGTDNDEGTITISCLDYGKATVTAKNELGKTIEWNIFVTKGYIFTVLADGKPFSVKANNKYISKKSKGKWTSKNKKIAVGKKNQIIGHSAGKTTLYFKAGGVKYQYKVNVVTKEHLKAKTIKKLKSQLVVPDSLVIKNIKWNTNYSIAGGNCSIKITYTAINIFGVRVRGTVEAGYEEDMDYYYDL